MIVESSSAAFGPRFFYWAKKYGAYENFGDALSPALVSRLAPGGILRKDNCELGGRLLAIGSIIHLAREGDIIWGSGINGKCTAREVFRFSGLDIRALRGPLTRGALEAMGLKCPAIFGDPALLMPKLFPEFQRARRPARKFVIFPHYSDAEDFYGDGDAWLAHQHPWPETIRTILDAEFVISSALHPIVVAEAFGIPARLVRIRSREPTFKYDDYFFGTGRHNINYAYSISEALSLGGAAPPEFDPDALMRAFPSDLWSTCGKTDE